MESVYVYTWRGSELDLVCGETSDGGGQLVRTSSVDICTEVISISYADEAGQLLLLQLLLLLLLLLLAGKVLRPPSGSGGLNAFV